MAENDKDVLKKQEEERRKQMNEFSVKMAQNNGRNIGDNFFSVVDTPNGPAIGVKGKFDPNNLPDGWKYEPAYLLQSDYPQEGFVRMVNGERQFMPIKNIEDKSTVIEYRDITDVRNALMAANPHIATEQIQVDPQSGGLKLIGVVNDIRMPQGLEMQGGYIVDINDYNKKFEIKKELAHDSYNTVQAGSKDANTNDIKQAPHREDVLSKYEDNGVSLTSADIGLMNFEQMANVYKNFAKDKKENLATREKDDSYKSFDNTKENNPKIKAQYELAEAWVQAYEKASGMQGAGDIAFAGENSSVEYNACMNVVNNMQGQTLENVVTGLFALYDFENSGIVKTVIYFISNPKIANMFQINCNGMSPDQAINLRESLKNKALSDNFKDMIDPIKDKMNARLGLELESEAPVMERQFPTPNNNNYN